MIKKGIAPCSAKFMAEMMLVKVWSNLISVLPQLTAVFLFGGMTLMFLLGLADVACLEAPNFAVVTQ